MNKQFLVLPILLVLMASAYALVFIPPMIYFASVSIIGFLTNLVLFLAVWLAIKGYLNRSYFGKPLHEVVSLILGGLGTVAIVIFSSLLPLLIIHPILTREILLTSFIAGVLCFILLFLSKYRNFRLEDHAQRVHQVRSVAILAIAVIIVTFVSAYFALETTVLHTNGQQGTEFQQAQQSASMGLNKIASEARAPMSDRLSATPNHVRTLWFYPQSSEECIIAFEGKQILSVHPRKECYYISSDNSRQKIECPISLASNLLSGSGEITSSGSCANQYKVLVDSQGFIVE
jgi:4-amino-4-deoxy-L-arabinose transferase-like glycosyltransferase